jgi:hypothetical protein
MPKISLTVCNTTNVARAKDFLLDKELNVQYVKYWIGFIMTVLMYFSFQISQCAEPPYILVIGGKDNKTVNFAIKPLPLWKLQIQTL